MDKITIKNVSSARVVISLPGTNFRRPPMDPGRVITVTPDEYNELCYDPGFNTLVRAHYVRVSGLDEEMVETSGKVFDTSEIAKMLDNQDITAFAKFLPTAQAAEKETVVQLAIEKNITNSAFAALIQKYCNVDLIKAVNQKHLAEEN